MQRRKNYQKYVWLLAGTGDGPSLAKALIAEGKADQKFIAIEGGSAGGFTT